MIIPLEQNEFDISGPEEPLLVFGGSYDKLEKREKICKFERDSLLLKLNVEKWDLERIQFDKDKESYCKIENCSSL